MYALQNYDLRYEKCTNISSLHKKIKKKNCIGYYKTLKSTTAVLPQYSSYIASRGEFKKVFFFPHKASWNKDKQMYVTHWRTELKFREIQIVQKWLYGDNNTSADMILARFETCLSTQTEQEMKQNERIYTSHLKSSKIRI